MTENRDEFWHWAHHMQNTTLSVAEVHNSPTNNNKLYIYKRIQNRLYMCGHCNQEVPEAKIIKHHTDRHSAIPFDKSMYYLVKMGEQVQCLACGAEVNEKDVSKRSNEKKPQNMEIIKCDIFDCSLKRNRVPMQKKRTLSNYFSLKEMCPSSDDVSSDETLTQAKPIRTKEPIFLLIEQYKCNICDAKGLEEEELTAHHLKKHQNVPINTDIFKLKVKEYVQCICGLQMKKKCFEQHMEQFHPENVIDGMHQEDASKEKIWNRAAKHNDNQHVAANAEIQSRAKPKASVTFQINEQAPTICSGAMTFQCRMCCEDLILEENLEKHHLMKHGNVPISRSIFQHTKIKPKINRLVCDADQFKTHSNPVHSQPVKTPTNYTIVQPSTVNHSSIRHCSGATIELSKSKCHSKRCANDSSELRTSFQQGNNNKHIKCQRMHSKRHVKRLHSAETGDLIVGLCKCNICELEGDLGQNGNVCYLNQKQHSDMLNDDNFPVFTFNTLTGLFQCRICGKQMMKHMIDGHLRGHQVRRRIDTIMNEAVNERARAHGYHNIRISNSQFQQLMLQNRIFSIDQCFYLKEFK